MVKFDFGKISSNCSISFACILHSQYHQVACSMIEQVLGSCLAEFCPFALLDVNFLQALADKVGKLFSVDSLEVNSLRPIESKIVRILRVSPVDIYKNCVISGW